MITKAEMKMKQDMMESEDERLVEQVQQGDGQALNQLILKYKGFVRGKHVHIF